jgi:hypothetical protein
MPLQALTQKSVRPKHFHHIRSDIFAAVLYREIGEFNRADHGDRPFSGESGGSTVSTFGSPLGGDMVMIERAVHDRGPDLEHQMCPAGRPS